MLKAKATNTRFHIPNGRPDLVDSYIVSEIAQSLRCSADKATEIVEEYRGQPGFLDLGSHGDVRKHKRKKSMIRIEPFLLAKIKADHRKLTREPIRNRTRRRGRKQVRKIPAHLNR